MKQIIEILENDKIKTYEINYVKKKVKELKNDIKKYSTFRKCEISYDIMIEDAESYVMSSPYINFDEYIGVVKEDNPKKKCIEEDNYDDYDDYDDYDYDYDYDFGYRIDAPCYGGSHYVTSMVELKDYPYLFNILFGKYKNNERNIFETVLLYFNNNPILVPSINNDIKNILQEFCGVEFPKLVYDENIPIQEKILLIEKLFNSMVITFEAEESIKDINNQIKFVSKINACEGSSKTELLNCMKIRIKMAEQNRKTIDYINDYFMKNKSSINAEHRKILCL